MSSNNDLQNICGQPVGSEHNVGRQHLIFQGSLYYYYSEDVLCNRATAFSSITPFTLPTVIPTYSPSFITHNLTDSASNAPTFMPTTYEPTYIASLLPIFVPSTSP